MKTELTMLLTLVATIAIELAMLRLQGERRRRVLWSSVAVNVLTNVPLCYYLLTQQNTWGIVAAGELLVVAVEALWYRLFTGSWRQALVYSVLCNAVSFLVGLLLQLVVLLFRQ